MNKISSLLLESIVEADPSFIDIIRSMIMDKTTDITIFPLLSFLDEVLSNHKDIETKYNYLNITDKNDEISFIPNRQYDKFIENDEDLSRKSKNFTKIGRFIKQIYKDNNKHITDTQIEKFVNSYKSKYDEHYKVQSDYELKIVSGEEIKKWYLWDNYYGHESDGGELWKSCMKHTKCQTFFDLYINNPNRISLVVLTKSDKLIARSLLWNINPNTIYLDRIYGYRKSDEHLLKKIVVNDKFKSKKVLSYDIDNINSIKIPVSIKNIEYFPYLDSFSTMYVELNENGIEDTEYATLMNKNEHVSNFIRYELRETNGVRSFADSDYYEYSNYHQRYIREEDCVSIELIGKNSKLKGKQEDIYFKDECVWSDYLKKYLLKEDSIYLDSIKDYYIIDDVTTDKEFGKVPKHSVGTIYYDYKEEYKNITPIEVYSMNNDRVDVEKIFISKRGIKSPKPLYYNGYVMDEKLVDNTKHSSSRVVLKCESIQGIYIVDKSRITHDIINLCSNIGGFIINNNPFLLIDDYHLLKSRFNLNFDDIPVKNVSIYEFINSPRNEIFNYKKSLELLKGSSKERIKILNFKNTRLRSEKSLQIVYNDVIIPDKLFILKFVNYYVDRFKDDYLESLNIFYKIRNEVSLPNDINKEDLISLLKMIVIISLRKGNKHSIETELIKYIEKYDRLEKLDNKIEIIDVITFLSYEDIIFSDSRLSNVMNIFLEKEKSNNYNNSGRKIIDNIEYGYIVYDQNILFDNLWK